jgi:hypothetical protein
MITSLLRLLAGRQLWPAARIRAAEIELGLVTAPGARVRSNYVLTA